MLKNITVFALCFLFFPILLSAYAHQHNPPAKKPNYQAAETTPKQKIQFYPFPEHVVIFHGQACAASGCGSERFDPPEPAQTAANHPENTPSQPQTAEATAADSANEASQEAEIIYKKVIAKDTLDNLINELDQIKSITNN